MFTATLAHTLEAQGLVRELVYTLLLPPDIPDNQTIYRIEFDPEPRAVYRRGSNRYAEFHVPNLEGQLELRVEVLFSLRSRELKRLEQLQGAPRPSLDALEREASLRSEPKIEHDALLIRRLARGVTGSTSLQRIHSAIRVVTETLTYSDSVTEEQGAARTALLGTGDCTDYADLLVAILRADGIPSRSILGIYCTGEGTYHNWAEVWDDDYGWIAVDATAAEHSEAEFDLSPELYLTLSNVRSASGWRLVEWDAWSGTIRSSPSCRVEALASPYATWPER